MNTQPSGREDAPLISSGPCAIQHHSWVQHLRQLFKVSTLGFQIDHPFEGKVIATTGRSTSSSRRDEPSSRYSRALLTEVPDEGAGTRSNPMPSAFDGQRRPEIPRLFGRPAATVKRLMLGAARPNCPSRAAL